MTDMFTCPRRNEGPQYAVQNADKWIGGDKSLQTCNYCGSLNPDTFMLVVKQGAVLGTTSKDYKVYVESTDFTKFYFQHLSEAQRKEFVDLYNARPKREYEADLTFTGGEGAGMAVGYPGFFRPLPYFMRRNNLAS